MMVRASKAGWQSRRRSSMDRYAVLKAIVAIRTMRDSPMFRSQEPLMRGLRGGYHLASHILWQEWKQNR
jgi:hypothetical protein